MMLYRATGLICAFALSACVVGPDFKSPEAPRAEQYTDAKLSIEGDGANGQKLVAGSEVPADWWKMFGSKKLDSLIERGLANSLTVAVAEARLRAAQENLSAQVGAVLYPSIDGNFSGTRQQVSGAPFGGSSIYFSLLDASLSASYGVDLFGASKRYLESLSSQINYEQYQMQAARMTLAANIVTAAALEASLRGQIDSTQKIIADSVEQLSMIKQRYALGAVSQSAVLNQRTALAQARTTLPGLQKQLQQNRHLLNVLAGALPSESKLPEFSLDSLHLPQALPLSLPSDLVRQRPDILAAEALLHQASANVGVATANMYPSLTITGNYGSEAVKMSGLFGAGSSVWGITSGLVQPLFHGGELRAKKREAVATYDQAMANYREVVLQSFRDVADTLLALEMDGKSLTLQREAEAAAGETRGLVEQQYRAGAASYLELLNADQKYQQASIKLTQAEAARFADSAALIHALGGGWWNSNGGAPVQKKTADAGESRPAVQRP